MLSRERIFAALDYRPVDVLPLIVLPGAGGLYEHGEKLAELIRACGHDFGDLSHVRPPTPPGPECFDADGRYHVTQTDEWGTTWEYRIFGVWGHAKGFPLEDMGKLDGYRIPAGPSCCGAEFEQDRLNAQVHRQRFFLSGDGGMLFHRLHFLRPFDEVLMDITEDTPEINRLADRIVEYQQQLIRRALALDVDAVSFGDDFGTQDAPIFSPAVWRRFFKPRYRALFDPIRRAGKRILFHSCGHILPILEDLAELGVNSVWPQLPAYDMRELAAHCRSLRLAVQMHPDRGDLMQHGTAMQVRDYVRRMLDLFDTGNGGSFLHIEIDPGFRWETTQALFEVALSARR